MGSAIEARELRATLETDLFDQTYRALVANLRKQGALAEGDVKDLDPTLQVELLDVARTIYDRTIRAQERAARG